jgi:hypothetical protein
MSFFGNLAITRRGIAGRSSEEIAENKARKSTWFGYSHSHAQNSPYPQDAGLLDRLLLAYFNIATQPPRVASFLRGDVQRVIPCGNCMEIMLKCML